MMEHRNQEDQTIFEAGLDSDGEVWAISSLGQTTYDQYLEIIEMLLTDVYTETNIEKLTLQQDIQKIIQELEALPEAKHEG